MLIGSQAFQETPRSHAPAVIIALLPNVAAWGGTQIRNALGAAGTDPNTVGLDKLGMNGIQFHGLDVFGSGATVVGMVLGAITVFIITREFAKASAFALVGAILSFFGIMHGPAVGINVSPEMSISYLIASGILIACAKLVPVSKLDPIVEEAEPFEAGMSGGAVAIE
jgi:AGZA family xanthine/uracil permease-like MFS transporter